MQYQGRTLCKASDDTKTQATMTDYMICIVKEAMGICIEPDCKTV
jgi:hypothetical protein